MENDGVKTFFPSSLKVYEIIADYFLPFFKNLKPMSHLDIIHSFGKSHISIVFISENRVDV